MRGVMWRAWRDQVSLAEGDVASPCAGCSVGPCCRGSVGGTSESTPSFSSYTERQISNKHRCVHMCVCVHV